MTLQRRAPNSPRTISPGTSYRLAAIGVVCPTCGNGVGLPCGYMRTHPARLQLAARLAESLPPRKPNP